MELDPTTRHWLDAYLNADAEIRRWTETRDACRANLEAALGNDDTATIDGAPVITWKWVDSIRIDTKKVKNLLPPEMLQAVQTVSSARVFRVTKP